jgi:hypothetical protein
MMSFWVGLICINRKVLTCSNLSVLQQVESISVDRPYSKFSFVELEAATASFSPSKFSIDLK